LVLLTVHCKNWRGQRALTMRERTIIETLLTPLTADAPYALGLRDDAAVMTLPEGMEWVVTTDMLQAGVHFLSDGNPEAIAWKALATNLSDLAAMGATPHSYQMAAALSPAQDGAWLTRFCAGMAEMQRVFGIGLSGGDTIRTPHVLTLSITAQGTIPQGQALLRSTARVGDKVCVTGTLGDAAIGLALLQGAECDMPTELRGTAIERYWRPTPRLHEGIALRGIATACMDISDGLLVDGSKLCAASGVGATLYYDALPFSPVGAWLKQHHPELFMQCISAGDDYELLCTIPAELSPSPFLTVIGEIKEGTGVTLQNASGETITLPHAGYEH
jgi:thiamine-monophosphate kinase